jgi:hypothetical protein
MGEITECGLCGRAAPLPVILHMGEQPLAEAYGSDQVYPLALAQCPFCGLVQLTYQALPEQLFPPDHPYASGNSAALHDHFARLAVGLAADLKLGDLVVDIGANDGTLLSYYPSGLRRIAIEPTRQAAKCRDAGVITYEEPFTPMLASRIWALHGPARVVTATNVLAHVPRPHDFAIGARILLDDKDLPGLFVTENHDVRSVLTGMQVDTVYHEHLRYWSPATLTRLLSMHGLEAAAIAPVDSHGGSFRLTARPATLAGDFGRRACDVAESLHSLVREAAGDGPVYGISAATRATPLIHFSRLAGYLSCVCEVTGSEKIGKTIPGTVIPVRDEKILTEDQPAYALLFCWHIADVVIPKLRRAGYKGRFIVPLPEPRIIDD